MSRFDRARMVRLPRGTGGRSMRRDLSGEVKACCTACVMNSFSVVPRAAEAALTSRKRGVGSSIVVRTHKYAHKTAAGSTGGLAGLAGLAVFSSQFSARSGL